MKQMIKVYLEKEDLNKLKSKAGTGRGEISAYITKIAREPVVFLDENTKTMLKALDLK